jgi:hypothetical protein
MGLKKKRVTYHGTYFYEIRRHHHPPLICRLCRREGTSLKAFHRGPAVRECSRAVLHYEPSVQIRTPRASPTPSA